jgi:hypothetical protein
MRRRQMKTRMTQKVEGQDLRVRVRVREKTKVGRQRRKTTMALEGRLQGLETERIVVASMPQAMRAPPHRALVKALSRQLRI